MKRRTKIVTYRKVQREKQEIPHGEEDTLNLLSGIGRPLGGCCCFFDMCSRAFFKALFLLFSFCSSHPYKLGIHLERFFCWSVRNLERFSPIHTHLKWGVFYVFPPIVNKKEVLVDPFVLYAPLLSVKNERLVRSKEV